MNNKNNQPMLIGGAVLFRDHRAKRQFLLVKQKEDSDWELPKVAVRKGESSVRAVIRMTSEQAGMSVRILEEASRATGNTVINNSSVAQKFFYYLIVQKAGGNDLIGFTDFAWFEYPQAVKKLQLKREKDALRGGKEALKEWEKTHSKKQLQD